MIRQGTVTQVYNKGRPRLPDGLSIHPTVGGSSGTSNLHQDVVLELEQVTAQ